MNGTFLNDSLDDPYSFIESSGNKSLESNSSNLNQKIIVHKWGSISYAPNKSDNNLIEINTPHSHTNKFFNSSPNIDENYFTNNKIKKSKRIFKKFDPFSFDEDSLSPRKLFSKKKQLVSNVKNQLLKNSAKKVLQLSKKKNINTKQIFKTTNIKLKSPNNKTFKNTFSNAKDNKSVNLNSTSFKTQNKGRFLRKRISNSINYSDILRRNSNVYFNTVSNKADNKNKRLKVETPKAQALNVKKVRVKNNTNDSMQTLSGNNAQTYSEDNISNENISPLDNSKLKRPPQLLNLSPSKKTFVNRSPGTKLLRFNPCDKFTSTNVSPEISSKLKKLVGKKHLLNPISPKNNSSPIQRVTRAHPQTPTNNSKLINNLNKSSKTRMNAKLNVKKRGTASLIIQEQTSETSHKIIPNLNEEELKRIFLGDDNPQDSLNNKNSIPNEEDEPDSNLIESSLQTVSSSHEEEFNESTDNASPDENKSTNPLTNSALRRSNRTLNKIVSYSQMRGARTKYNSNTLPDNIDKLELIAPDMSKLKPSTSILQDTDQKSNNSESFVASNKTDNKFKRRKHCSDIIRECDNLNKKNKSPKLLQKTVSNSNSKNCILTSSPIKNKSRDVSQTLKHSPCKNIKPSPRKVLSNCPGSPRPQQQQQIKNLSYFAIEPNPTLKFRKTGKANHVSSSSSSPVKKSLDDILNNINSSNLEEGNKSLNESKESIEEEEKEFHKLEESSDPSEVEDDEEEEAITDNYTALMLKPKIMSDKIYNNNSSHVPIIVPLSNNNHNLTIHQTINITQHTNNHLKQPPPKEKKIFTSSKERRTMHIPKTDFNFMHELDESEEISNQRINIESISETKTFSSEMTLIGNNIISRGSNKDYNSMQNQNTEHTTTANNYYSNNNNNKEHENIIAIKYVKDVKQAYQCHEFGEVQDFKNDVEYLIAGLKSGQTHNNDSKYLTNNNNTTAMRCLSVLSLATKCLSSGFRTQLRAQGLLRPIFNALRDVSSQLDPNLKLCSLAFLFTLTLDQKMHSDILDDSTILQLLASSIKDLSCVGSEDELQCNISATIPLPKIKAKIITLIESALKSITSLAFGDQHLSNTNSFSTNSTSNKVFENRLSELNKNFDLDHDYVTKAYNLGLESILNVFCYQKCVHEKAKQVLLENKIQYLLAEIVVALYSESKLDDIIPSSSISIKDEQILIFKKMIHIVTVIENILFLDPMNQHQLLNHKNHEFLLILLRILCKGIRIMLLPVDNCNVQHLIPFIFNDPYAVVRTDSIIYSRDCQINNSDVIVALFCCILKYFLNVTHENEYGSKIIVQSAAELIMLNNSNDEMRIQDILPEGIPLFIDLLNLVLSVQPSNLTEKSFEMIGLVLCFVINLLEYCESNKLLLLQQRLARMNSVKAPSFDCLQKLLQLFFCYIDLASHAESDNEVFKGVPKDRISPKGSLEIDKSFKTGESEFISRDIALSPSKDEVKTYGKSSPVISAPSLPSRKNETVAKQAQNLMTHILDKAGQHMEYSLVASYIALVFGCLIQNNPKMYKEIEDLIIKTTNKVDESINDNVFEPMINVLRKFIKFIEYSTACGVSTMKLESITNVIKAFENYHNNI